jgi:branched-subunit amino acid transport protein
VSWLPALALAGLLTFATRLSFIALLGRVETPPLLTRALRYVPPAVLSAIVFPELLLKEGKVDVTLHNQRLLAGLLAVLVAWRTKSVLLTIAVGMGALWALQLLVR